MVTGKVFNVVQNKDQYARLATIQYALNKVQVRLDAAASELIERDKTCWSSYSSRHFAALKRELLNFKLDIKL